MIELWEILLRLLLSAVFGGAIGFEREMRARSAGLRTHALVGLGSTMFMIVSQYMWFIYGKEAGVDPSRIAAQIITGIGFIGAGTIMKSKFTMRGLTTAASIWTVASIGMAVGAGMYLIALMAVGGAILILAFLESIEHRMNRSWYSIITVWADDREGRIDALKTVISDNDGRITNICVDKDVSARSVSADFTVKFKGKKLNEDIAGKIASTVGVKRVRCE